MTVYFFILVILPFSDNVGCLNYMKHRDWYYYVRFPDAFYANTVICFVGWVSYLINIYLCVDY